VENPGLPSGRDIIAFFQGSIRPMGEELSQPCPAQVIDVAYAHLGAREMAYCPEGFVLIHGDAHSGNVLEASDGSFKLVDPDGLCYEKAYDLGVLMREWTQEYQERPVESGLARRDYLHRLTGVDRQAIWAWGFIQSVSTGLLCLKVEGLTDIGRMMLGAAEAWTEVRL
jgi:streptomycin 6-kinase